MAIGRKVSTWIVQILRGLIVKEVCNLRCFSLATLSGLCTTISMDICVPIFPHSLIIFMEPFIRLMAEVI